MVCCDPEEACFFLWFFIGIICLYFNLRYFVNWLQAQRITSWFVQHLNRMNIETVSFIYVWSDLNTYTHFFCFFSLRVYQAVTSVKLLFSIFLFEYFLECSNQRTPYTIGYMRFSSIAVCMISIHSNYKHTYVLKIS